MTGTPRTDIVRIAIALSQLSLQTEYMSIYKLTSMTR
jgi:hypothetical protein